MPKFGILYHCRLDQQPQASKTSWTWQNVAIWDLCGAYLKQKEFLIITQFKVKLRLCCNNHLLITMSCNNLLSRNVGQMNCQFGRFVAGGMMKVVLRKYGTAWYSDMATKMLASGTGCKLNLGNRYRTLSTDQSWTKCKAGLQTSI